MFEDAKTQLEEIDNKIYYKNRKHLFGLSLMVAPIFSKDDTSDLPTNQELYETFRSSLSNLKANVFGLWRVENDFNNEFLVLDKNNQEHIEKYYGIFFFGKLTKYSRK